MANIRSIYGNVHSRMRWPTSFKYTFDTYFEIGMRTRSAAKKFFFSDAALPYLKVYCHLYHTHNLGGRYVVPISLGICGQVQMTDGRN